MTNGSSGNPAITITAPVHGNSADVVELMPGMDCSLCLASGTTTDNGLQLQAVFLKIYQDFQGTPGDNEEDDTATTGEALYPTTSNWTRSLLDGSACSGPNTLVAVGEWFDNSSLLIVRKIAVADYTANKVGSCTDSGQSPSKGGPPASAAAAPFANFVEIEPTRVEGNWLTYHLDLTNRRFGNKLMFKGSALRADTIAVAAPTVRWHLSQFSPVQRPWGDYSPVIRSFCVSGVCIPNNNFNFSRLPPFSTVVWQLSPASAKHVVTSECRSRPDYVNLDHNQEVYAQVNDFRFPNAYASNTGIVELDVQLIS